MFLIKNYENHIIIWHNSLKTIKIHPKTLYNIHTLLNKKIQTSAIICAKAIPHFFSRWDILAKRFGTNKKLLEIAKNVWKKSGYCLKGVNHQ
jgi:hypothetical protein